MAGSRESFQTVRDAHQHQSVPQSHDFAVDVADNDTAEREGAIANAYDALVGRQDAIYRSGSEEEFHYHDPETEDGTLEQADVIAELIHSLRNSEIIDPEAVHVRNASAYSFEPLDFNELDGATEHSQTVSSWSVNEYTPKDSGTSLPPYTANVDSAVSLNPKPRSARQSTASRLRYVETASLQSEPPGDEEEALPDRPPEPQYPPPAKLALILISLYIAIFLVALDRTIIGPAIPEITNKFNSLADIGWYGSAYMLTSCGFILLYGRVYTFFPTKLVFLTSIVLFEIGSAVCGAASSSLVLIIGRAIAGFGSSGIFTGAILIILEIVPLHRRPLLQGLFGACFGVASVAGPLLGGAFTGSALTWRWCFYINLPLGGFTIIVVMVFLHFDDKKERNGWKDTFFKLDPLGTLLFLPSITCLLLALEWGAADYAWNDPRIIGLLTAFAVLLVAFIAWQAFTRHTTATVPARVAFQRSVAFGGLSQFAVGATMLTVSMYLPLWFQAIKNISAMQSGIRTIPLVLSVVLGSIWSGGAVQKIGYYTPFMLAGAVLMSVGAGLLTTWNTSIASGMWIGYQVILGLGVGFTMQHPNLAIQIVLPKPDIPTGTALLSLCQTLGGAVFVAVGQNTFIDKFVGSLESIEGIEPEKVLAAGATALRSAVPEPLQARVFEAYNTSLTQGPFFACMFVACLTVPAAFGMEWRSVKEGQQRPPPPPPPQPTTPPDEESPASSTLFQRSRATTMDDKKHSDQDIELEPLELPEPSVHSWRNSYRMVGDFSWVLVKRINPDLKDDLPPRRR